MAELHSDGWLCCRCDDDDPECDATAPTQTAPAKEAPPTSPTVGQLETRTTAPEAPDLPDAALQETLATSRPAQLRIQVKHEQDGGGWQRGRHRGESEVREPEENSSTATWLIWLQYQDASCQQVKEALRDYDIWWQTVVDSEHAPIAALSSPT